MTEQEFNSTCYGLKVRLVNLYKPNFPGVVSPGVKSSTWVRTFDDNFCGDVFEIFLKIRRALEIPEEMLPTKMDGPGWVALTARLLLKGQKAKIMEAYKIYVSLVPQHSMMCDKEDEESERQQQESKAKEDAKRFDELYRSTIEKLFIDKGILVPQCWRK